MELKRDVKSIFKVKKVNNTVLEKVYSSGDIENEKVLAIMYADEYKDTDIEKSIKCIFKQKCKITLIIILDNCEKVLEEKIIELRKNLGIICIKDKWDNVGKADAMNQFFDVIHRANYEYDYAVILKPEIEIDEDAIINGINYLNSSDYGAVFSYTTILKNKNKKLLWCLQNMQGVIIDKSILIIKRSMVLSVISKQVYLFKSDNYIRDIIMSAKIIKCKIKIDNSVKTFSKQKTSLKNLFKDNVSMYKDNLLFCIRKGISKCTVLDISSYVVFMLIFLSQIFVIANMVYLHNYFDLLYGLLSITVISSVDALVSIKRLGCKSKIVYLAALLPIPVLYSIFNSVALVFGYFSSLCEYRRGDKRWD